MTGTTIEATVEISSVWLEDIKRKSITKVEGQTVTVTWNEAHMRWIDLRTLLRKRKLREIYLRRYHRRGERMKK